MSVTPALRCAVAKEQAAMGVHVIGPAHALRFMARANRRQPARPGGSVG